MGFVLVLKKYSVYGIIRHMSEREYVLKHKDVTVLYFKINEDYELEEITEVLDENRQPFGLKYIGNEKAQYRQFADWIENRGLPRSRSDLTCINRDLKTKNSVELSFGSYALNLTDHYWVHKKEENILWKNVNFFENEFIGLIDFDFSGIKGIDKIVVSPDLTVDGNLRKKWIIDENKERFLIKGSRYDEMQEPFNEAIASKILKELGIECVKYSIIRNKSDNMPLSVCKCMVDNNYEFLPARYVIDTELKGGRNDYDRIIDICKRMGINDVKERIDEIIALDFLIGNVDRHGGNFGILRDSETLEWKKIVPIFDNGNSLCYNKKHIEDIERNINSYCYWLRSNNYDVLSYIDYPRWYKKNNINNIKDIVYTGLGYNENMSKNKRDDLYKIIDRRVNEFEKVIINKKNNIYQGFSQGKHKKEITNRKGVKK